MSEDDQVYFQYRAEVELAIAQRSTTPRWSGHTIFFQRRTWKRLPKLDTLGKKCRNRAPCMTEFVILAIP